MAEEKNNADRKQIMNDSFKPKAAEVGPPASVHPKAQPIESEKSMPDPANGGGGGSNAKPASAAGSPPPPSSSEQEGGSESDGGNSED